MRQSFARARAARCSPAERDVLAAVVELVCSYSRLVDRIALARVASAAERHPKTVAGALHRLAAAGIVVYEEGGGRSRVSLVGLPSAEKGAPSDSPSSSEKGAPSDSPSRVAVDEPESFTAGIAALGPTPDQRRSWRDAYDEDAAGFLRVLEEALRAGRAPAALLTSKLQRGEHRGRAGRRGVSIAEVRAGTFGGEQGVESDPQDEAPRPMEWCLGCDASLESSLLLNGFCPACAEVRTLAEVGEVVNEGVLIPLDTEEEP
jgi:hypothetical protein